MLSAARFWTRSFAPSGYPEFADFKVARRLVYHISVFPVKAKNKKYIENIGKFEVHPSLSLRLAPG